MKFEAIKHQVATGLHRVILHGGDGGPPGPPLKYEAAMAAMFDSLAERRPFQASLEALANECRARVLNWDVRCVGKLRELFPDLFPPSLRKGPLVADYCDDGEWMVERAAS